MTEMQIYVTFRSVSEDDGSLPKYSRAPPECQLVQGGFPNFFDSIQFQNLTWLTIHNVSFPANYSLPTVIRLCIYF